MSKHEVHIGDQFAYLTVISDVSTVNGRPRVWVRCICGQQKQVRKDVLVGRATSQQSCGCIRDAQSAQRNRTHGEGSNPTPEYFAWRGMIGRCYAPSSPSYSDYGERGIRVCDRWLHSYPNFLQDMGRRPTSQHSLDHIDVNGDYAPNNCRWATRIEQANNTRRNHFLTFRGETKTLTEWARSIGIKRSSLGERLRRGGWTVERALTTRGDARHHE